MMFSEVFAEYFGKCFTASGAAVFKRYSGDYGFQDGAAVGVKNILQKNEARSATFNVELANKSLTRAQGYEIVNLGAAYHGVDAAAAHFGEREARALAEFMARKLKIVKVIGVVDNAFRVKFVVAHFQLKLKYVLLLIVHIVKIN